MDTSGLKAGQGLPGFGAELLDLWEIGESLLLMVAGEEFTKGSFEVLSWTTDLFFKLIFTVKFIGSPQSILCQNRLLFLYKIRGFLLLLSFFKAVPALSHVYYFLKKYSQIEAGSIHKSYFQHCKNQMCTPVIPLWKRRDRRIRSSRLSSATLQVQG